MVMTNQQAKVLYKSTDNLMKDKEFEKLCSEVVSSDAVPLLTRQLLHNGQLAKVSTEFGYEVIKLSPSKAATKGLKVTDIDVGIIRCAQLLLIVIVCEDRIMFQNQGHHRKLVRAGEGVGRDHSKVNTHTHSLMCGKKCYFL